jgi:amino acid transporter/mannitol/fructose-specific phosphotransferase system IIA component (Ntr-type)/nucleotide-binding universal stress UspA family protein
MKALKRTLGVKDVVAISMATMMGSGIFVLPGLAFAKTGPSLWLAYLLAALTVLPAALSKAELGTAMPAAGGTYVYLERSFGPLIGTVAGFGLWTSLLLKSAFALVGFAAYLYVFARLPLVPTALVLLVGVTALNVGGVKAVSRVQMAVVAIAVVTLLLLIAPALAQLEMGRFQPHFSHGGSGLLAAAALVFVSYAGVTKVAAIAEEVENPGRVLPAGMFLSVAIVTVLYVLVSVVLAGVVPANQLVGDLSPIHTLARSLAGPVVAVAVAVVAVFTMTSMANGGLLASSRFPFAMSRDELLPRQLGAVNERWLTPVRCILLTSAGMAAAIVFLDVERIAKLASALKILLFMGVNVAVIVLRESRAQWYEPTFRSPGYPWFQVYGIVSSVVLLVHVGVVQLLAAAGFAFVAWLLFLVYGRKRAKRRGVLRLMGPRRELLTGDTPPDSAALDDGELGGRAAVAVPLLGRERSPEMLVELGIALADGRTVEVLQVTEVPEQTTLDAVPDDHGAQAAVRRRITAMAEEQSHTIRVESLVSRDIYRTVHAASARLNCEWLVVEWPTRSRYKRVLRNPLGWLFDHLECNLAVFRDAGVRTIREILVYTEPGPHDALVVWTADHLASLHDAGLTFVRFVPSNAPVEAESAELGYLEQLRQLCEAPTRHRILRAGPEMRALAQATAAYDLLVMSATAESSIKRRVFGSARDRLVGAAACSVLALKTPRRQTHEAFEPETAEPASERLLDYVNPAAIDAALDLSRKDALFAHVAEVLAGTLEDIPATAIQDAMWERERTQNTAVGHGLAIPHATVEGVERSSLGVFVTRQALDYQAPDGQPVDVFFALVGPAGERQVHLLLLSKLSRMVVETPLLERLRAAERAEQILDALDGCDMGYA